MKPIIIVQLEDSVSGFSEDKDLARNIRINTILPAIANSQRIVLDFSKVTYSTQSFVHALIGEALQTYREPALNKLEFKGCSPQVKSLIQLVVDYSLGAFATTGQEAAVIPGAVAISPTGESTRKGTRGSSANKPRREQKPKRAHIGRMRSK